MKKCLYIFLISSFCLAVISCDTKNNTSDTTSIDNTTTTVRIWIPLDGGWFQEYSIYNTNRFVLQEEILFGGCLTVKNQWGLLTGDDVTDLEISIRV